MGCCRWIPYRVVYEDIEAGVETFLMRLGVPTLRALQELD
jgi:hypothetical protein